jgi:hypothetical protein
MRLPVFLVGMLLMSVNVRAQQAAAGNPIATTRRTLGVLIGLNVTDDGQAAAPNQEPNSETPPKTAAANEAATSDDEITHDNTPEAASPFQTVWILKSTDGIHVRFLQDIIVPRKSGFWRLGTNRDSATSDNHGAVIDFFWTAPLGTKPKLAQVGSDDILCYGNEIGRELQYVGPEYFGYSESSEGMCIHTYSDSAYVMVPLDDPGGKSVSLNRLLGPEAAQQQQRLNRSARHWSNEDCGQPGFAGGLDDWVLKHSRGTWHALAKFHGTGYGICDRIDVDRTLKLSLPKSLVGNNVLPVTWKQVLSAFPNATDVFPAPGGELLVIFQEKTILLVPVEGQTLGKPIKTIDIPHGTPVMAEWALGANALHWSQTLSSFPAPNPNARPHAAVP